MAVSKRLRYEVLRRDAHACRYCGAKAPSAELTIDHVVPTALGGEDKAQNLITACMDCNSGKAASNPDAEVVAGVADDALRWAAAMRKAAEIQATDQRARDKYCGAVDDAWGTYFALPSDWRSTVERWYDAGLDLDLVLDCIDIAFAQRGISYRWKYFCGIVYRRLNERQQIAQDLIGGDA